MTQSPSKQKKEGKEGKSTINKTPVKAPAAKEHAKEHSKEHSKGHSSVQYEFGGPIGALGIIVCLPMVTYALFFLCNKDVCVENILLFDYASWIGDR